VPGVELARETIAFIEAAGKEAPPRRVRLRLVLDTVIEVLRVAVRGAVTGEPAADAALGQAAAAWEHDPDACVAAIGHTLAALDAVERNANLAVLVDAWTAVLEEPRLAGLA
jgi:hypothetical protein